MADWLLYEHDDGRHAIAPSAEAATFAHGDPKWHRVGPVAVAPSIHEQRLRAVLDVVNSYLPPHGVSAETAMTQIIDLVDPWPAGVMASDGSKPE